MEWVYCHERLPVEPGRIDLGPPLFVAVGEFGCDPRLAVARCWISAEHPKTPKWYLDPDFYGLDAQVEIADDVIAWMEIPDLPRPLTLAENIELKRGAR